jgi:hypothetical protein
LHFNKGLAGAPQEEIAAARDTATNPAVLKAFALAIIAGGGRPVYPGIPGHEPDLVVAHQNAKSGREFFINSRPSNPLLATMTLAPN